MGAKPGSKPINDLDFLAIVISVILVFFAFSQMKKLDYRILAKYRQKEKRWLRRWEIGDVFGDFKIEALEPPIFASTLPGWHNILEATELFVNSPCFK
jgi:hypothetical protein